MNKEGEETFCRHYLLLAKSHGARTIFALDKALTSYQHPK